MKRMNKIMLVVALCVGTQAFGWEIIFDRNTYLDQSNKPTGEEYAVLTLLSSKDLSKTKRGEDITDRTLQASKEVIQLVGEGAGTIKVADPQTLATAKAIQAGSKLAEKLVDKGGLIERPITFITREINTIDYISRFKPSTDGNYLCRDAKSLSSDHAMKKHKVKSNKDIFYVIYSRKSRQMLVAAWGPAYGLFTFRLIDFVDENGKPFLDENGNQLKIGEWKEINKEGGKKCSKEHREISIPS